MVSNLGSNLVALGNENKFTVQYESDAYLNDFSNWVCVEWFQQWSLTPNRRGRGEPRKLGWLYTQITIWDKDDLEGPCGCAPRIEVGYSTCDEGEWELGSSFIADAVWENYGLDEYGYCPGKPEGIWNNGGVAWNEKGIEWYFCVPLFCINTLEDLDKRIIDPALKLLSGQSPSQVFNDVPAFRFKLENDLLLPLEPLEIKDPHSTTQPN